MVLKQYDRRLNFEGSIYTEKVGSVSSEKVGSVWSEKRGSVSVKFPVRKKHPAEIWCGW